MKGIAKAVAGLALAASAAVVTACGGSGADRNTAEPSAIDKLALPADEFPVGFQAQQVPKGPQMQQFADIMLKQFKSMTVTPQSCMDVSGIPASIDVNDIGLSMGTRGTSGLTVTVTRRDPILDQQRAMLDGECGTIGVTFVDGMLAGASGEMTQHLIPAPESKASDAMAFDQEGTFTDPDGVTQHSQLRIGIARVNGYTVQTQYQVQGGGTIDEEAFNQTFVAAVQHVADNTVS